MDRKWTPNVGPWMKAQRGKKLQATVISDLAERGVSIDRSWLSRAENGARISDDLLDALQDYYGSVPPPYEVAPDTAEAGSSDVVAAMDRQTAAIDRQTAMLGAVLMTLAGPKMSPELAAFVEANWPGSEPTPLRPLPVAPNG